MFAGIVSSRAHFDPRLPSFLPTLTESTKKEMNDVLMEIIHDAKTNYEKADLKISKLCNSMLNSQNNYVIVKYKEPNEC